MTKNLRISERIILNDGNSMPLFGLGVWANKPGKETYNAVLHALKKGYRHIDTAEMYGNEKDVGTAIIDSGISREKIFVTTKLWDSILGYEHTLKSFDESLKKMNLEYIHLYLKILYIMVHLNQLMSLMVVLDMILSIHQELM